MIFVFGSNTEGRHGKGAALFAKKNYGAKPADGVLRCGWVRRRRTSLVDAVQARRGEAMSDEPKVLHTIDGFISLRIVENGHIFDLQERDGDGWRFTEPYDYGSTLLDELARLASENAELREAVEDIARDADLDSDSCFEREEYDFGKCLRATAANLRAALARATEQETKG